MTFLSQLFKLVPHFTNLVLIVSNDFNEFINLYAFILELLHLQTCFSMHMILFFVIGVDHVD